MNKIEVLKMSLVAEKLDEIVNMMSENDFCFKQLKRISVAYNKRIELYNKSNFEVVNKTNIEKGTFRSSVKKMIKAYFHEDRYITDDQIKCIFSDETIDLYILLNRHYPWNGPQQFYHLRTALKEALRTRIMNEYLASQNL